MNHLWNLIRKELKELLTPASVISIVVVAILFASLGGLIGSETDKAMELPSVGIVSGDGGVHYENAVVYINDFYGSSADKVTMFSSPYDDRDAIMNEMNELGVYIVLVFDANYSDDIDRFAAGTGSRGGMIDIYVAIHARVRVASFYTTYTYM